MKYLVFNILLLINIVLFYSACNKHIDRLNTDPLVTKIFEEKQVTDLQLLLDFYNNQICKEANYELDIIECYKKHLNLIRQEYQKDSLNFHHDIDKMRAVIFEKIEKNTFNEIWEFSLQKNYSTNDSIETILLKRDGKYFKLLKELGKRNPKVKYYHKRLDQVGDIGPSLFNDLMENFENYGIEDIKIRLLFTIHYITIIDTAEKSKKIRQRN